MDDEGRGKQGMLSFSRTKSAIFVPVQCPGAVRHGSVTKADQISGPGRGDLTNQDHPWISKLKLGLD
jgi:hypothetical protein